jgi:hypothetical protein
MQAVVGGLLPIGLAYWREMRERAAFLKKCRISILYPKGRDYLFDLLHICASILSGMGYMAALFVAFPELRDYPVNCVKGWEPMSQGP